MKLLSVLTISAAAVVLSACIATVEPGHRPVHQPRVIITPHYHGSVIYRHVGGQRFHRHQQWRGPYRIQRNKRYRKNRRNRR